MLAPELFLTKGALDAIHAHLALAMGREVRDLGSRESGSHLYGVVELVAEVDSRAASNPASDACWLAALYGMLILSNAPYRSANQATALMAMYVVLARDGRRLVADPLEVFTVVRAVRREDISLEHLAAWLCRNVDASERISARGEGAEQGAGALVQRRPAGKGDRSREGDAGTETQV